MKHFLMILVLSFSSTLLAADFDYSAFVKRCGWGTVWGAGLGLISLAFENHPYDHFNNVAKGASLGLYGGMIYGLSVPPDYQKIRLDNTPVESTPEGAKLFFNQDWVNHKSEVLLVYSF